jgi:hypothetical protein
MDGKILTKTDKRSFTVKKIIYYIVGVLEVLLAIRLVFKLLGANPSSGFVSYIYTISQGLLVPFNAIFRSSVTQGIETKAVLEPSIIIAMVVYALIAWGFVKLIVIMRGHN